MSLCIWPECAVCVHVMFNNYYKNFMACTSQIWPDKKRHAFLILQVCRKS